MAWIFYENKIWEVRSGFSSSSMTLYFNNKDERDEFKKIFTESNEEFIYYDLSDHGEQVLKYNVSELGIKKWDRSIESFLGDVLKDKISEEQIEEYESRNLLIYHTKLGGGWNKNGKKTGNFDELLGELKRLLRNNKLEEILNG